MSGDEARNGWNEWSKHVLKELQRLNNGQDSIKEEIHGIKSSMSKLSILENQVDELKRWKNNVTEVASSSQLKELIVKVNDLDKHKIKTIAIFTFMQIAFGVALGLASYLY